MMAFPKLADDVIKTARSETAKYRHLTWKYCCLPDGTPGVGIDIGSQGDAVVPWAMSVDLPTNEFNAYCDNNRPNGVIHLRGHADALPFEQESLDFVYSSHLLEDFNEWQPVLREWLRVLRPNGYLIILIPDKERWDAAIAAGQSPNCAHKHEGRVGELSEYAKQWNLEIIQDALTDQFPGDYTILAIFRKIQGGW